MLSSSSQCSVALSSIGEIESCASNSAARAGSSEPAFTPTRSAQSWRAAMSAR